MELNELYQELIIDHGRKPRNFFALEHAQHKHEGFNPLCGDRLTLYLQEIDGVIMDVSFVGAGCAISMASASLMTEAIKGKKIEEVQHLFQQFHKVVTGQDTENSDIDLGKLIVFAGVGEYPMRVKCATLAWHTLSALLQQDKKVTTTE